MKIRSFQELYVHELQDLFNAEQQILKALSKMAEAAQNSELKAAFKEHHTQTEGQVTRLEQIFEALGQKPGGVKCKATEGLVAEGEEIMGEIAPGEILDAALIGVAQRVEHYEMAGYGTARSYAHLLGHHDQEKLLQATLDEEGETDKKLNALAEKLNKVAVGAR